MLAVQAGADVLLKPSDVRRAIDAVEQAVVAGTIPAARIDSSARRILEAKALVGLNVARAVSLDGVRREVGSPEHWAVADAIAARAITLLRDSASLVPVSSTAKRIALVTYAPETELRAGQAFAAGLRQALPNVRVFRLSRGAPRASSTRSASRSPVGRDHRRDERAADRGRGTHRDRPGGRPVDRYPVDAREGDRRRQRQSVRHPAVPAGEELPRHLRDRRRARARGRRGDRRIAPITARAPISLPGFFARGDGLARPLVNAPATSR